MGLELVVARVQNLKVYRFNATVTDLSCGTGQQIITILVSAPLLALYDYCFRNFSIINYSEGSYVPWVVAFIAVDFAYYWWHRATHRVNFFWSSHVVHHQSQDYNLAVALRQAWISIFTIVPFYLPIAFLGIPTEIYVTIQAFSTLYQFWIHTRTIGTLGPLEWVINTPSHHRVHHAVNPEYVDKNYAATLIIWDRLFGTFAQEKAEPVYGLVKPFNSWDPVWANFEFLYHLAFDSGAKTFYDRLKIWWAPPEWIAGGGKHIIPKVDAKNFVKFDTPVPWGTKVYVAANSIFAMSLVTYVSFAGKNLDFSKLLLCSLIVMLSIWIAGALIENKTSLVWVDAAKYLLTLCFFVI